MLKLSNQKILFNSDYLNTKFFRQNFIPVPIFFAMPVLAFHVNIVRIHEKRNFIQETILYLKRNGVPKNEIAEQLCLDSRLVNRIIENSEKDKVLDSDNPSSIIEKENQSEDFYIFYDLISKQFINGFMKTELFNEFCKDLNEDEYNLKDNCYYFRENIGDSHKTKIRFLCDNDDIFNSANIKPKITDIISCHKNDQLFDENSYKNAKYLNEFYPLWLTLAYSTTAYNANEYSTINPFINKSISYSTYFTNIIEKQAKSKELKNASFLKKDILDYKENTKNTIIKNQNESLNFKNNAELTVYKNLSAKYSKFGLFKSSNLTKLEQQLVFLQNRYNIISNSTKEKRLDDTIRTFFDFANNTLEQLLMYTLQPYILSLNEQLVKDCFFDKISKEKEDRGQFIILKNYFDKIAPNYDFTKIIKGCSVENIKKFIRKKNILRDKSYQLGINDLIVINALATYYNSDSKFGNIFKNEIPYLDDLLLIIETKRKTARHSGDKVEVDKNNCHDTLEIIYKIIDSVFGVNEPIVIEEKTEENDKDFSEYIGSYEGIEDLSTNLQMACNLLLRDTFNASPLYFSDCVVGFQETAKVILEYVMSHINSDSTLLNYFEEIPNNQDDAKILLMAKLEKINIFVDFDKITINIEKAKECILNNFPFKSASTLIFFAPLLLAIYDYTSFLSLFEKLGKDYFIDAINSINDRGHSGQALDWNHPKLINDRFLNYCKILTKFEREEI